jgi:triacylglycerol lipase
VTPILLHHGLFGFGNFRVGPIPIRYFSGGIERAIIERGHPLILGRAHPTGAIEVRARQLKELILHQLKSLGREHERIVIFAHSLGGLDARHMITHLGMADRVAALVTLATPHRGSPYADWVMQNLGQRLGGAKLMGFLGIDVRAIADLTTSAMSQFNDRTPDAPQVDYYSIAGTRPMLKVAPIFVHAHRIVSGAEGENDGLVSLNSARWGEFMGAWPADHLHIINKRFTPDALLPRNDVTPRYAAILENLRRRKVLEDR